MDNVLKSAKIAVERKQFFFDLKENDRGRFLRITEDVNGRRDTIILPSTGLEDFAGALNEIIDFQRQTVGEPVGSR
ncbi:MAG: PUR family DNA/RNA-binding protein [Verrucomicrobiota bacterium]